MFVSVDLWYSLSLSLSLLVGKSLAYLYPGPWFATPSHIKLEMETVGY
jgi:hypothetical protein